MFSINPDLEEEAYQFALTRAMSRSDLIKRHFTNEIMVRRTKEGARMTNSTV